MSVFLTVVIAAFMLLYLGLLILDVLRGRSLKFALIQAAALGLFAGGLHLVTGFPSPHQAFGGPSPITLVAAMLICTVLGMAAEWLYNTTAKPNWFELIRPFAVSPIILLPLLGSVLDSPSITTLQFVSFAFLAFQNGFFWKAVLDRARQHV